MDQKIVLDLYEDSYFSSVSSNSKHAKGVAILFNNNFEFKVLKKIYINGKYLTLEMLVEIFTK